MDRLDETGSPALAWPGGRYLLQVALLASAFTIFFLTAWCTANAITGLHSSRWDWHLAAETRVPFVPVSIPVYLSLDLLILMAPFVFRRWLQLVPLLVTMAAQVIIASVLFVLIPLETVFTTGHPEGLWGIVFALLGGTNWGEFNHFPSLHVAFAVTLAIAYFPRFGRAGRVVLAFWTTAILASTLTVHEHHLVDIAGGALLAAAGMAWVYPWASDRTRLETLWVESICLYEFAFFIRRHRRYLVIFLIMYWHSLRYWRAARVVRVAYCLAQHVDDVLDGDRRVSGEPELPINELIRQLEGRTFDDSARGRLAACMAREMEPLETNTDRPYEEMIALFRHMVLDRIRVREGLLLSIQQLEEHHERTFYMSVNLMLLLTRSDLRAADAPDLITAFGWCSTFRDLQDDLQAGLVNVPREVIRAAEAEGIQRPDLHALSRTRSFRQWVQNYTADAEAALARHEERAASFTDRRGQYLLRTFHRSMVGFARRFRARHRDWFGSGPNKEACGVGLADRPQLVEES